MKKWIDLWKRCWRHGSFKILLLGLVYVIAKVSSGYMIGKEVTPSAPSAEKAVIASNNASENIVSERYNAPKNKAKLVKAPNASYDVSVNASEWTSPAGLYYGEDPSRKFDTRIDHVMAHTRPDSSKPKHSIFRAKDQAALLKVIDEAWGNRGPPKRQGGARGRDVYTVDMGRVVGEEGQRNIRIVVESDSADMVTAYPVFQ